MSYLDKWKKEFQEITTLQVKAPTSIELDQKNL